MCPSLAVLREASEADSAKQHETWESELNGTHDTQMHSMWPLNSCVWVGKSLPLQVLLFTYSCNEKCPPPSEGYLGIRMIEEKEKHLIEFSQGLCAKCILHYSSVRVSHKISILRI